VRNPIGTAHRPHIGPEGATILVKLHQFDGSDTEQMVVDTCDADFAASGTPGIEVLPLHAVPTETVELQRWRAGASMPAARHEGGQEVFVLEGTWEDEHGRYPAGTWVRNPPGFRAGRPVAGGLPALRQDGHLAQNGPGGVRHGFRGDLGDEDHRDRREPGDWPEGRRLRFGPRA
jgi:hypothetical protein